MLARYHLGSPIVSNRKTCDSSIARRAVLLAQLLPSSALDP